MDNTEEIERLHALANEALHLWSVSKGAHAELINLSENATFLVTTPKGYKSVLRIHRVGYNTRRAIESELLWLDALRDSGSIDTPQYYKGQDGSAVQEVSLPDLKSSRHLVLFHFIDGTHPDESNDLNKFFEDLGATAAKCHSHVLGWEKPAYFERMSWDLETIFGPDAKWGNWRDAPRLTASGRSVLEATEDRIKARLKRYGKAPERYNLIHADMRLANLLLDNGRTKLIDFDDCGFGWLMYDFAAAISFMEDDERVPKLLEAWLRGYSSIRHLPDEDILEIPTFVMLRRLALLAWVGSRSNAAEPQSLAPHFAEATRTLAEKWLAKKLL
jgi:Ser/Thr protein kinase RdoA (MazF antagonist)